ncbi:sugar transporter ERD6-like 5 [Silene latifolia]|uniref:sugar transporter ERD6-like 5 n=1 Tax=Silene latifolia TaxID=37657 RepID=UPI003D77592B
MEEQLEMEEDILSKQELLLKNGDAHGVNADAKITSLLITSIFISILSPFVAGCSVAYSSPVQSQIISDLSLSTADYSLFGSALSIGGLFGSILCGRITDYLGRRATIGLIDVLGLVGWLSIAYSQGAWSLDIGRVLLGFANSLSGYAVPVYIAEISPKNIRGGLMYLGQVMYFCGITTVLLVGVVMRWRLLALIGVLPCMVQFLGIFFIPESPRWLVNYGRGEDYVNSLQRLRGKTVDISREAADIRDNFEHVGNIEGSSLTDMFHPKYAYALTVGLGLTALASFGGATGILYYATAIFESAGFSGTIGTIAMALFQLPPSVLGVFLMDKFGRLPLLMFSAGGMSMACLSLALSFLLKEHGWLTDYSPYLALIGVSIFSATYPIGMGGVPAIITSEIYPMNIKGAAGSFISVIGYFCDLIVSYSFNFMIGFSSPGTFFLLTSINVFTLFFVGKFVPETKGRTLEEIQVLLTQTVY